MALAGSRVRFETNIDNYGEIWIDGQIDRSTGVIVGLNAQHRVEVSASAVAGARHVIACLVANGPLAEPRGGIFLRYATLAFESPRVDHDHLAWGEPGAGVTVAADRTPPRPRSG